MGWWAWMTRCECERSNCGRHQGREKNEERAFTRIRGFRMTMRKKLAHAGYYYCDVVGLFGCAGPLFGRGYQVFGDRLRAQAALAEDFIAQAVDAEFFAVNIFGFGQAVAEGYEEAAGLDFDCALGEFAVFDQAYYRAAFA